MHTSDKTSMWINSRMTLNVILKEDENSKMKLV